MKSFATFLTLLLITGLYPASAYASGIYRCDGSAGEPVFSEQPCPAVSPNRIEIEPDTEALEAIRKEIIQITRRKQDLETSYQQALLEVDVPKLESLITTHRRQVADLDQRRTTLEHQRDQLMNQAFDAYLELQQVSNL